MVMALLRRLRRDRSGASLVEFALTMPLFVLMILGGTEIARYVLLNQKLDRLATATADLTAQEEEISAADLSSIFEAASNLTWPFSIRTNGVIVVSSIGQVSGQARVLWQRTCPGNGCSWTGTQTSPSRIGVQGGTATLPSGFTVGTSDNVIVSEVFYNFEAFMWRQMPEGIIYHSAYTRPRLSNLDTLN